MMNSKVALLAGASGLVGQQFLALLLDEPTYSRVIVLVRKPLAMSHPKLEQQIIDFSIANAEQKGLKDLSIDHAFCTLGTTIKRAGSKVAFRQVDQQYAANVAQIAKDSGAQLFGIVTAMSANSDSMFFYNKVKGDIERQLQQMNFQHLAAFRPSMLAGDRNEKRFGEQLGSVLMRVFGFMIPQNYKIIDVKKVAAAMLDYAKNPALGFSVISSGEMLKSKK
ncbi:MAG: NAD-dependent epimerase/dehydratase family protein [Colwellia sp.]|nr:NAD-dependent epimerase/dehydratase family protein [Colwellia sp.]